MALVSTIIPEPPREVRKRRLAAGLRGCARAGLTSVHDAGGGLGVVDLYMELLAAGALPAEAAWLANIAGGLVVMKRGTAAVTPADFAQALATEPRSDGPGPRN